MADQVEEPLSSGGAPSVLNSMSTTNAAQQTYTSTSTSIDEKPAHKQR